MYEVPYGFCNKCNNVTEKININNLIVCNKCGWCESLHQYVKHNCGGYTQSPYHISKETIDKYIR